MHTAGANSSFLLILILTTLLSALISPSLSLPAPHPPVNSVSHSHTQNTALFRRAPTPNTPTRRLYTISGCDKHAPAECKGLRAGRIGDEAHCSADGTYSAHNTELVEKCQSFGCRCKPKKGKGGNTLFGLMFSKSG